MRIVKCLGLLVYARFSGYTRPNKVPYWCRSDVSFAIGKLRQETDQFPDEVRFAISLPEMRHFTIILSVVCLSVCLSVYHIHHILLVQLKCHRKCTL